MPNRIDITAVITNSFLASYILKSENLSLTLELVLALFQILALTLVASGDGGDVVE